MTSPFESLKITKRNLLFTGAGFGFTVMQGMSVPSKLTVKQEAIIQGNLLGDGHLQLSLNGKKARLRFTHSTKQQQYTRWVFDNLGSLTQNVSEPKLVTEKGKYTLIRAYTSYDPELKNFHTQTYREANANEPGRRFIKEITPEFAETIKDPLALMIWYLDDGTLRNKGGVCRLATQGFTLRENEILQEALTANFGITAVIEKWPGEKVGLYIPSRNKQSKEFVNLFKDIVINEIPSMAYKVEGFD